MGCPVAPTYANLLLGWWEDTMVFGEKFISFHPNIMYWGRFIDDIMIIWTGTRTLFKEFVHSLNENEIGLKFTCEIQETTLCFLDVNIHLEQDGTIKTSVYRKPTAGNSLLRWESHHPLPLKRGIPKGQYLRLRRNCSTVEAFKREADLLRTRFRDRGYPNKVLKKAFHFALNCNRQDLLIPKQIDTKTDNETRIIGTFDQAAPQIREILNKFWPILRSDPLTREIISNKAVITFRRGRNLGDSLTNSHFTPPTTQGTWLTRQVKGTYRCGSCKACQFIKVSKTFSVQHIPRTLSNNTFANCKSSGVIYLATCPCPKSYVGKTIRELRRRVLEHVGDIEHSRPKPIAIHMRTAHPEEPFRIQFQVIEVINRSIRRGDFDNLLLRKEAEWTFRLKTLEPQGLNDQLLYTSFI
ncbi:uncharacterized protein [Dendropsophus ebraccatus]|uniref:uncharacterized protein n=1 Tax=Dendropsophus ebraccatus TaxID=150705 RepID=UPI003831F27A